MTNYYVSTGIKMGRNTAPPKCDEKHEQQVWAASNGQPDIDSFQPVYTFSVQVNSVENWCTSKCETGCDPALLHNCANHPAKVPL